MFLSIDLHRRENQLIIIALTGITLLAWYYLVEMAAGMPMMQFQEWNVQYFWTMFLMWGVMMIGMMVPSAIPMIMIYASIAKKAASHESKFVPISIFISGYIIIWLGFSLLATTVQWILNDMALITPMMMINNERLAAVLVVIVGVYQFIPAKKSCLNQCRSPVHFISIQWKPGIAGAFLMGLQHGLACLGCCWLLMSLLFVGGVMNFLWIAIISLFVLLEKLTTFGDKLGYIVGGLMIFVGGLILLK